MCVHATPDRFSCHKKSKKSYPEKCEHSLRIHLAATSFPGHCQVVPNLAMINCPWFCMASYSFRSSSDSSTSWMTTVRGGSLTSGLPSSSSDFSRLMEICLRSFCKRLWAKEKKNTLFECQCSQWRRNRHFTWLSEQCEGLPVCRAK